VGTRYTWHHHLHSSYHFVSQLEVEHIDGGEEALSEGSTSWMLGRKCREMRRQLARKMGLFTRVLVKARGRQAQGQACDLIWHLESHKSRKKVIFSPAVMSPPCSSHRHVQVFVFESWSRHRPRTDSLIRTGRGGRIRSDPTNPHDLSGPESDQTQFFRNF
jgi:hypothetical protein